MTAVVVVGAGLAGLCAAVSAAEVGATVTVLEKTSTCGGSTVLSGGFLALADTAQQRELGITDSADLLVQDMLDVGEHRNDPDLVRAYADGQPELVDWLNGCGLAVADVELSAGQSVARSHRCDPRALIASLAARAQAHGVELRFDTPMTGLVLDGGRVVGVDTADGVVRGEVVLTCGGFTNDDEMMAEHAPAQTRALRVAGPGNTGDGLRIGAASGAAVRDLEFVKGTFGTHPDTGTDKHELLLLYYLGAIIVNRAGERYVDESISYKLLGDACLAQDDPVSFQVFDQALVDASPVGVPLFDPRSYIDGGMVVRADSLAELATLVGVPGDALDRTVATYNAAAHGGTDPFGRTGLVHGSGGLVRIATPPYYAYPSTSVVIATYCGLHIDPQARVLDTDGRVIPGLRAAGEVTGGFHGAAYMTGSSLGKAAFFGRAAGLGAATA